MKPPVFAQRVTYAYGNFTPIWHVWYQKWMAAIMQKLNVTMELRMCDKHVVFLPVNVPTVWRTGFLSCTVPHVLIICI